MTDATSSIHRQNLTTVYGEICQGYRAVDDTRMKLLGLLPFATGAGLLVLTDGGTEYPDAGLAAAAGVFGFFVSLGLFAYELHGIKKCASLIDAGALVERELGVFGQFQRRPHEVAGLIDEPFAASLIYPSSMAAWAYFSMVGQPAVAAAVAGLVFLLGLLVSQWLIRAMESDLKSRAVYRHEPWLSRRPKPVEALPGSAWIDEQPDPTSSVEGPC